MSSSSLNLRASLGLSPLFEDPISFEVMRGGEGHTPVLTPCGHSFARASLQEWVATAGAVCPLCNEPLGGGAGGAGAVAAEWPVNRKLRDTIDRYERAVEAQQSVVDAAEKTHQAALRKIAKLEKRLAARDALVSSQVSQLALLQVSLAKQNNRILQLEAQLDQQSSDAGGGGGGGGAGEKDDGGQDDGSGGTKKEVNFALSDDEGDNDDVDSGAGAPKRTGSGGTAPLARSDVFDVSSDEDEDQDGSNSEEGEDAFVTAESPVSSPAERRKRASTLSKIPVDSHDRPSDAVDDEDIESAKEPMLLVEVVRARDLINKHFLGKVQPFAAVDFLDHRKKSSVVAGETSPMWRETFALPLPRAVYAAAQAQDAKKGKSPLVRVTVWDHHGKVAFHDFLGHVTLDLSEILAKLAEGEPVWHDWFPLQKRSPRSKVKGDLKLHITLIDPEQKDLAARKTAVKQHTEKSALKRSMSDKEALEQRRARRLARKKAAQARKAEKKAALPKPKRDLRAELAAMHLRSSPGGDLAATGSAEPSAAAVAAASPLADSMDDANDLLTQSPISFATAQIQLPPLCRHIAAGNACPNGSQCAYLHDQSESDADVVPLDDLVGALTDMGFSDDVARRALVRCRNHLGTAMTMLLSHVA